MVLEGAVIYNKEWDQHSLLGWLNAEWLYMVMVFGFIVGVVCVTGSNYAVCMHMYDI